MKPRTLHFRCRGHPQLKATHAKTLELTREEEITARATCVVGVAADFDPEEVARLRGPLRITLRLGELTEEVSAIATPFLAARAALVFRKSGEKHGRTFAYGASHGAADLGRDFTTALGDSAAELEVEIAEMRAEETGAGPGADFMEGCLYLGLAPAGPPDEETRLRLRAVDFLAASEPRSLAAWREAAPRAESVSLADPAAVEELLAALAAGGRAALALAAADPLADASAWDFTRAVLQAGAAPSPLEGMPPWLATLLVSGQPRESLLLVSEPVRKAAALLARISAAPLGATLVLADLRLPASAALATLEGAGERRLTLGRRIGGRREAFLHGTAAELERRLPGRSRGAEPLTLVVEPFGADEAATAFEPLLEALLEDGVSSRTAARALRRLPGISRRRAYTAVERVRAKVGREAPSEAPGDERSGDGTS